MLVRLLALSAALAALALLPATAAQAAPAVGATLLVSGVGAFGTLPAQDVADAGTTPELDPDAPSSSADGRYIAFTSQSDGLSSQDDNRYLNVFRKDRTTGEIVLVSRATDGTAANSWSYHPTISADGSKVAFTSLASNLQEGDTDPGPDVFVRDLTAGTTTLISTGTTSDCPGDAWGTGRTCGYAAISGDGTKVAYETKAALVAGDTNNQSDIYRRPSAGGTAALVSQVEGTANAGNERSTDPSISTDGSRIAYTTLATNLASPAVTDTNSKTDVYLRDMTSSNQVLISGKDVDLVNALAGESYHGVVSGNGAFVMYTTDAKTPDGNAPDTDTRFDLYRRSVASGANALIGRADGLSGAKANGGRQTARGVSDDGTWVLFSSFGDNLGGSPAGNLNLYVRHYVPGMGIGTTANVSVGPLGDAQGAQQGALSRDGARAVILSDTSLDATRRDERQYYERATGPVGPAQVVSAPQGAAAGYRAVDTGADAFGEDSPTARRISQDGTYAVFTSTSDGLSDQDDDTVSNVYRRNLRTGAVDFVSRADGATGAPGNDESFGPSISLDGSRVAFMTRAPNLGATPTATSVLVVRDLNANTTQLVSRADGPAGAVLDTNAGTISGDGRKAVFSGFANGATHTFVRDLAAGTTVQADVASGAGGASGNKQSWSFPSISDDGSRVAFASDASNLSPDDPDTNTNGYVRDLTAATTTLATRAPGNGTRVGSYEISISGDGKRVAFVTSESAAVPGVTWPVDTGQLVVRDLAAGTNVMASRGPANGAPADADPEGRISLDATGDHVAWASMATNLVAGQADSSMSVFVRTLSTDTLAAAPLFRRTAFALASFTRYGANAPSLSVSGACLLLDGQGEGPISAMSPDYTNAYLQVLSSGCLADPTPPPAPTPVISGLSLTNTRFRLGTKPTAIAAKRSPRGTTIRLALSIAAAGTLKIEKTTAGRRKGSACVKPTRALRKKRRCTRYVKVATLTRAKLGPGAVSIPFSGIVGRRKLSTGSYRLTVTASASGKTSLPATARFRIVTR